MRTIIDLSWACGHPWTGAWPSRFLGMWRSFSESPMNILFLILSCMFLVSLLLASTGNTTSGICNVKQLLLTVFHKCPGERTEQALNLVKKRSSLKMEIFRELPNRLDVTILWWWGFQEHQTCVVLGGCSVAGFHSYHSCKATGFLG